MAPRFNNVFYEFGTSSFKKVSFAEYVGSYRSNLFPQTKVSSNGTSLFLKSIKVNGILHPSSDKDRFLYEVVSPLEYTLYENNAKQYVDASWKQLRVKLTPSNPHLYSKKGV